MSEYTATGAPFNHGETVYVGPFTVATFLESEGWWGLHVDGEIDRYETEDRIVSGSRIVRDDEDHLTPETAAAIRFAHAVLEQMDTDSRDGDEYAKELLCEAYVYFQVPNNEDATYRDYIKRLADLVDGHEMAAKP